ncbi:uncharacterized protein LOC113216806 isoform X3 [Frankliniella occidentalis]|uniref:Uncharacterized protein LOC113216806 isoform X3 n=1 Tax=Frankliniella occidentalis TaxID=133901 RepID=A0A9C6X8V0_FRAOC|nr:uncharacterized protein LOC113216806 isoform X3 [Frankliniella occidentalis]
MKRSSTGTLPSSRSQRLLSLAKQKYEETNLNLESDENQPPPESPCPVLPDDPDYLQFSDQLDNAHNGQGRPVYVTPHQQYQKHSSVPAGKPTKKVLGTLNAADSDNGQGRPLHVTPHQQCQKNILVDPVKPTKKVLGIVNADDSVELRSPPKKIIHIDKGLTTTSSVENEAPVTAKRSLLYDKSEVPKSRGLGLTMLAGYESEDSRSSQEFPGVQALDTHSLSPKSSTLEDLEVTSPWLEALDCDFTPAVTKGDLNNNGITTDNIETSDDDKTYTELKSVSMSTFDQYSWDDIYQGADDDAVLPFDPVVQDTEEEVVSIENEVPQGQTVAVDTEDDIEVTPALVQEPPAAAPPTVHFEEIPVDQELAAAAPPTVNDEDHYPKPARSQNPDNWKQNQVKKLKESGQAHVSLKGKVREKKTMKEGCSIDCKRHCQSNFTHDDRLAIFKKFYAIENHTTKWYFISNHVKSEDVKRRTVVVVGRARKNVSNTYYLPLNGVDKQVCRKFFLHTLAITEKCVRTAREKKKLHIGSIPIDGRGKKKKRKIVCTVIRDDVMNHIKKYHTIEGHYTRKSSKARYLPEFLNRRMMHSQYLMEKQAEGITENVASLRQYRDVFKKEFNLKFFKPKKDQCSKCLSWKNKTPAERTEEASQKYHKHISDKKISQDLKTEDIEFVKQTPNEAICVATCDLEKVFLCPKGENSEFYYKSKLSLYNFTIFVSGEQKGLCYVWDQTEARRGSAEISSCLWSFLKMKSEQGVKEFRFYSDNCSAQNKNRFLFSMYIMASIRLNVRIVHRYLETGHTHMEVDSVHAAIQNSLKNKEIFVPNEWYAAIKLAKKTQPKYEVIQLKQEKIHNFANLDSYQAWEKLKTSEFKEVVFDAAEPGFIYYKTQYDNDAKKVNVIKRKPGHPVNWKTIPLQRMYQDPIPLRPIEMKDLKSLCDSGAIPSRYHNFYQDIFTRSMGQNVQPPPPPVLSDVEDSDESNHETSDSDASADSDSGE